MPSVRGSNPLFGELCEMLTKREVEQLNIDKNWTRYCRGEGREDFGWTYAERALNGSLSPEEYDKLDKCYCSYGPDGFKYVGPAFGPVRITDPDKALIAYGRAINLL